MEKQHRFVFTLTPQADELLEELYLQLKRKKPKSVLLNEMIVKACQTEVKGE